MLFGNYSVSESDCSACCCFFSFLLLRIFVENARSLDSTELVDPVTLKVTAGPRMGTRRRLEILDRCSWSSWSDYPLVI